jgi:hypothetical protein
MRTNRPWRTRRLVCSYHILPDSAAYGERRTSTSELRQPSAGSWLRSRVAIATATSTTRVLAVGVEKGGADALSLAQTACMGRPRWAQITMLQKWTGVDQFNRTPTRRALRPGGSGAVRPLWRSPRQLPGWALTSCCSPLSPPYVYYKYRYGSCLHAWKDHASMSNFTTAY